MAHNKNTKNSEGLCQKIHNAVSPFRARVRRISHQPQGSISVISNKTPTSENTKNPIKISSPQTKPVHVLHQPSLSKTIPVEFEQPSFEREVLIVKGQKFTKSDSRKKEVSQPDKPPTDQIAKAKTKKDDDLMQEVIFSNYISKVKDRMLKTASSIGGGDGGKTSPIKDSFNDKVTNYINHAKIKVRKTTSVGDEKGFALK